MRRTGAGRTLPFLLLLPLLPVLTGAMCLTGSADLEVKVLMGTELVPTPEDIRKLVLVNRYENPDDGAVQAVLGGFGETLERSPFFWIVGPTVKRTEKENVEQRWADKSDCSGSRGGEVRQCLSKTGYGRMPAPLAAMDVARICDRYEADGLVSLEVFTSTRKTTTDAFEYTDRDKDGKEQKKTKYSAQAKYWTGVGWRIYDCRSGYVIDEYHEDAKDKAKQQKGKSEAGVLRALKNPIDAGSFGRSYAKRITPLWVTQKRSAFCSGSSEIKEAFEEMAKGRCAKAEQLLEKAANSPKEKASRRATYNLALCKELRGDLAGALEVAEIAGGEKDSKKAREYQQMLRKRIEWQRYLKERTPTRFAQVFGDR